jgi:hypothetical protein
MRISKIALAVAALALMSTPAWALPASAPSNQGTENAPATTPVGPPSTTPNNTQNPGSHHRSPAGNEHTGGRHHGAGSHNTSGTSGSNPSGHGRPSHPGNSHKCLAHNVAYVAAGTLVSQTLSKDAGTTTPAGTYSGELTVAVTRTNHHAAADKGTTKTYKVEHVRVTFALADINSDGSVGLDDVQAGDRVRLIGKITALAKHCDQSGFTAQTTIRHIVLHPAAHS